MFSIGIDIGTTSICGVLIDVKNGVIIKKLERVNDTWIETKNAWEKIQDPNKILTIVINILDELYSSEVISIGLTGQMHGIVYLDEKGNAVSPLYTWQDERGNLSYLDSTYAKNISSFTGYGNVTHYYNKINNLVPKKAKVFCTIHDFVAMKFCSLTEPIIHNSDAASFGLYDIVKNCWQIQDKILPKVTVECMILGNYKNTPVAVAIGDNQASFIGSVSESTAILINMGTGSQISVVSDKISTSADVETRPFVNGKYLLVGCSLCGGKTYAVLENFFRNTVELFTGAIPDKLYDVMNKELEKECECKISVDNRFMGTRANPKITASITGLNVENFSPQQLLVGFVTAMAGEMFSMYEKMGTKGTSLVGSGNGIKKNKAVVKALEKKFSTQLKIPVHNEEASFGAALFSLVACGYYDDIAKAQKLITYKN